MDSGKILTSLAVTLSFWAGLVLVLLLAHSDFSDKAIATPITEEIQDQEPAAPLQLPKPPAFHAEIAGEISKGESFDQAMKRLKIADPVRVEIIKGFAESLDFRMLQPGDRFSIALNPDDTIARAVYESGLLNTHILQPGDDGTYHSERQAVLLEYRLVRVKGIIDSSLYAAFIELGEEPKLIHAYADIFASKIDFNTETRAGDTFELLVEKYYKGETFVGYGRIKVARYVNQNREYVGYHFASEKTPNGYFDENGEALGTSFIRSPIPFGRVTSRFSLRRKHPIDGVVRPHLGVDLAAPRGTPVMATADGKVEFIGRKGGFGKTVIIKHYGEYKTYYGHLNGYKKGLRRGSAVRQKEIIGYVGSTGKSTGPHLDYRIKHKGVFRNPFGIKFKAKITLKDEELALFRKTSAKTAGLFNADKDRKILQVENITLSDDHKISFL